MYTIDLNISKEGIPPQHFINKTEQLEGGGYGEYTASEFAVNLILSAVAGAHPKGNIQTLRRTIKLKAILDKGGTVQIEDDDFKYLRSSFDKCTDWNNNIGSATIIDRVYKIFEQAMSEPTKQG